MYGPEAPPLDWDTAGRYGRGEIELYYLSHSATPLKKEDIVEVGAGGWLVASTSIS